MVVAGAAPEAQVGLVLSVGIYRHLLVCVLQVAGWVGIILAGVGVGLWPGILGWVVGPGLFCADPAGAKGFLGWLEMWRSPVSAVVAAVWVVGWDEVGRLLQDLLSITF